MVSSILLKMSYFWIFSLLDITLLHFIIIIIILSFLSMLLVSRYMDLWKITSLSSCDKLSFPLFQSSASSFISPCLALFLKWSRSSIFFFLVWLQSSVLQWQHEEGNLFLEYVQSNSLSLTGYCLKMSSILWYIQELHYLLSLTILYFRFSSSTTFRRSPFTSAPIFLVSRSLSHTM